MESCGKIYRLILNKNGTYRIANKMAFTIEWFYASKFSFPRINQQTAQDIN